MKRIAFLVIACCAILTATAQISFNVKAGVGAASFLGAKTPMGIDFLGDETKLDYSVIEAWRIGVGMEYEFSKNWSFAPSLNFTAAGARTDDFEITFENAQATWGVESTLYYLQLPLDVQWKTSISRITTLGIYAGPYLGFGVGGETKITDESVTKTYDSFRKDAFKKFDFGLNCGVNFDINHFIVGADFGFGLLENSKYIKGSNFTGMAIFGYRF